MRRLLFALALVLALAAAPLRAQQPVSIMHGFADMTTMTLWLQTERPARVAVDLHAEAEAPAKRRRIEGATHAEDDFALPPAAHRARPRNALSLPGARRRTAGRRARDVRDAAAVAVPHRAAGARDRVRVVRVPQRPVQPPRPAVGRRLRDLRRDCRARARPHALAGRQRVLPRAGVDVARGDERALPRVPRDAGVAQARPRAARISQSGTTTTSARTIPTARSR